LTPTGTGFTGNEFTERSKEMDHGTAGSTAE